MKTQQTDLFKTPVTKSQMAKHAPQKKPDMRYMPNTSASQVATFIKKDCRIIGLTRGQFSLIDLIHATLTTTGKADIIVVTWSAGIKDANTVKWMLTSKLINSFLLITDHSFVTRQQKYALAITELFGKENIRTSEIHAKFVLIKNDEWNICIRSSMNLNANKTCENFEIDDNKEIYAFYEAFVTETFGQTPQGFTPDSSIVNQALDRVLSKLTNSFDWQQANGHYSWQNQ